MDKIQRKIILIFAIVFGAGALYTAWIYAFGSAIPCYFNMWTGLQCPGCGSSRMFLALFRGDVAAALNYNAVAFFAFPCWFIIAVLAFIGHPRAFRSSRVLLGLFYVTIGAYVLFCIIRNVI